MQSDPKMLSVAEVCELPPGDKENAVWINPGFQGVVRTITLRQGQKKSWPCIIADTIGSATLEVCFFQAPKFEEGDLVEFSGKGLRRTEYNGKAQAAIGKDTNVHVLGKSVHHEEQKERVATSQPALNGQSQPVPGQTVGMAMKEALTALVPGNGARINTSAFWFEVHQFASDVIRVSRKLEAGKLAPSVKERAAAKPNPQAGVSQPPTPPIPPPPPKPSQQELDEDVPF